MTELSIARCRRCRRLSGIEVVQCETDLLAALGAYRPRLSTVVARRRVRQHDAGQVAGRGVVECPRRHTFPTCFARQRRHCRTTARVELFVNLPIVDIDRLLY